MSGAVDNGRLHDGFLGQRAFGSLDGLRALSILAVVWIHTHPGYAWVATQRGLLGVDLFFVISGFLIVTLLRRERRRTGAISLRAFYTRRALRIFPLFYGVLLLALLFAPWIDKPDGALLRADLPWAALYLANWVPLRTHLSLAWSLSTEEQFYLCWPLVEKWATSHRPLLLLLGAMIGVQLAHAHADFWPAMPRAFAETGFTPILLGVGLAHLCDEERSYSQLRRWLGHRTAAPAALLLTLAAASLPGGEPLVGWPRLAIQLAMALLVAACVVREDHVLAPLLGWRPLARLGKVSYGAYLLHMPARHVVSAVTQRDWPHGGLVPFAGTLALAWLFAEISYRCYETPFLRLKERWSRVG